MTSANVAIEAPTTVLGLWWVALGLTVVVIVPLAIYLLHRTWQAARNIRRYTAEALEAGAGIVENVSDAAALGETEAAGAHLVRRSASLREAADELAEHLGRRAG